MPKINIAVITSDALLSLGLKHLLLNLFDIKAAVYHAVTDSRTAEFANADLLITDSESFAGYPDFFIPRRNRTLIVSSVNGGNAANGMLLNRYSDETKLIAHLTEAIDQAVEKPNTGNDLSQREIDVLAQVASGFTNKEIADNLNISVNTVLTHRKNITAKLGIKSVSGLSVYAMMNGYITQSPATPK